MAVVSVGSFISGTSNNVIPTEARLELTVRTFNREVRALLERRVRDLVVAQAESFGVSVDIDYRHGYPVMMTTPAETALARSVGIDIVGTERVVMHGEPVAGSEDFAYMLEQCPGSFLLIGNGHGEGACMVHNPDYDFDDKNIVTGAAYWSLLATRFLQS
jgi:hippurate hydrolase